MTICGRHHLVLTSWYKIILASSKLSQVSCYFPLVVLCIRGRYFSSFPGCPWGSQSSIEFYLDLDFYSFMGYYNSLSYFKDVTYSSGCILSFPRLVHILSCANLVATPCINFYYCYGSWSGSTSG